MIHGKIWIALFAIPSFVLVRLLFRISVGAGAKEPKWIWYWWASVIAVFAGPMVAYFGYGFLDELFGPDWLSLHPQGLGVPDPFFGPREVPAWYVAGGVLGEALAIFLHLIRKGNAS